MALADSMQTWFLCLYVFRYFRLVLYLDSTLRVYRAIRLPNNRMFARRTIILPTADPGDNADFEECLVSCLVNESGALVMVTNSNAMVETVKCILAPYKQHFQNTKISIKSCHNAAANKR
ncbi:hypothetical protein BDV11DRAFT_171165 [Aspergillus similis]